MRVSIKCKNVINLQFLVIVDFNLLLAPRSRVCNVELKDKQHQKSQFYNFQTPRKNSWTFKPLYYIPRWSPLLRKRVAQTLLKDPKEGKWLPPASLFLILVPEDSRTILHFLLHTYPTSDKRLPRGNPIILSISNKKKKTIWILLCTTVRLRKYKRWFRIAWKQPHQTLGGRKPQTRYRKTPTQDPNALRSAEKL
jgi:hypothetical protein